MSKKQPKLTPWFPGDVKPVRTGVYEKKFGPGTFYKDYQYWDGERWYYGENTPEQTMEKLALTPDSWKPNEREWRGLAVKP